jgi:hypothetical protein
MLDLRVLLSAHRSANDGLVLFRGIFKRKADKPVMSYSLSQENCEGEGEGFARREARAGAHFRFMHPSARARGGHCYFLSVRTTTP